MSDTVRCPECGSLLMPNPNKSEFGEWDYGCQECKATVSEEEVWTGGFVETQCFMWENAKGDRKYTPWDPSDFEPHHRKELVLRGEALDAIKSSDSLQEAEAKFKHRNKRKWEVEEKR